MGIDWSKLDENIWHPFGPLRKGPRIPIERGEGAYLITPDGRRILDGVSSWWVNLHGHANPDMARAIYEQAGKLEQVIFAGFSHEPALQLSEHLLSVLPKEHKRIFFSDDGSTSVEVALKLAIQYWYNLGRPRRKILALDGAYHGDTFGALALGERGLFTEPYESHLFEVVHIPFPEGDGSNSIEAFKTHCDDSTAAFIFEPLVQGAGGMRIYDPSVLDVLLDLAREHEVVTIADEVMTGFYRTGKFFATDYLNNDPDIVTMSKGLTGGYLPMGITAVTERVVSAFDNDELEKTFWHGHSYTANPLACAAANKSFEILMHENTQQQIQAIAASHEKFRKDHTGHEKFESVKSLGTILSINFKAEKGGYTSNIRDQLYHHFLDHDILLRPLGNVVYILPPYVMTLEDLNRVYQVILAF